MQRVVEDCLCLDANRIAKMGLFNGQQMSANLTWQKGSNIWVIYSSASRALDLEYDLNGIPNPQMVRISAVACHFGGFRYYFHCPGCGSRRYKLRSGGSGFYCRDCYRLPYYSQECGYIDGISHKIHKLEANLRDMPKNARTKTRERMEKKLESAESEWSNAMLVRFGVEECRFIGLGIG